MSNACDNNELLAGCAPISWYSGNERCDVQQVSNDSRLDPRMDALNRDALLKLLLCGLPWLSVFST
jgi:hypothetical protein